MPTNRKQIILVFSDLAQSKLESDAETSECKVQDIVREIVNIHYKIKKPEKIVRGRPVKSATAAHKTKSPATESDQSTPQP